MTSDISIFVALLHGVGNIALSFKERRRTLPLRDVRRRTLIAAFRLRGRQYRISLIFAITNIGMSYLTSNVQDVHIDVT